MLLGLEKQSLLVCISQTTGNNIHTTNTFLFHLIKCRGVLNIFSMLLKVLRIPYIFFFLSLFFFINKSKTALNTGLDSVIVMLGNETIKCTVLRRDKMQLAKKLLWSQWHFQKIIIQYTLQDMIDSLIQFWWNVVHILKVKQYTAR